MGRLLAAVRFAAVLVVALFAAAAGPLFPVAAVSTASTAIAVAAVLWPDGVMASEQALKESLEKVTTLAMGPVAKTGLTVTTIIGTVAAAAKHSVGLAAIVMGMGVALSYYLTYLGAWGT